jgi:Protein of unknown function (DUF3891)
VIVRRHNDDLLLITQPDHAALASHVMAHWRLEGLIDHPRRDVILLATREHDSGWTDVDAAPLVDERTGGILDFVRAPDAVRQSVWPVAVERLRDAPFAAALVAQHAITVYDGYRSLPGWQAFFSQMEDLRRRCLAAAAPLTLDDLLRDYRYVLLGDRVSLTFATQRPDPWRVEGYEMRAAPDSVTIQPDPFGGQTVPFSLSGRLMADVPYSTAVEAAAAFTTAPVVTINAVAMSS